MSQQETELDPSNEAGEIFDVLSCGSAVLLALVVPYGHKERIQMFLKRTGLLWADKLSGSFSGMGLSYFGKILWPVGP